jgi:hypothetical protein
VDCRECAKDAVGIKKGHHVLTINLRRFATAKEGIGVFLIDHNPENSLGSAYSGYDECLLALKANVDVLKALFWSWLV